MQLVVQNREERVCRWRIYVRIGHEVSSQMSGEGDQRLMPRQAACNRSGRASGHASRTVRVLADPGFR